MSEPKSAVSPNSELDAPHAEPPSSTAKLPNTEKVKSDDASAAVDDGEYGGPKGLEPTRYGDWEKAGRCIDF